MVTLKTANGITLSANASQNGFPLRVAAFKVPGMGDYAERNDGRQRRRVRRERISDKRAFLSSRD